MLLTVARAFIRRGIQEDASYRLAFLMRLVAVSFSLTSFFFLSRFVNMGRSPLLSPYGGNYLAFSLVGLVLLNLQYTTVAAYAQSIRDAQNQGTFEGMMATPTPGWMILICAPLYRFLSSFLWAAIYLLVGGIFFGVAFREANLLSVLVTVPLCLLAFASLGFIGAALTMLLRRNDPISFFLGGVSALFGGVLYPTAVLPSWMQTLGKILPITHALDLVRRAVFKGATLADLAAPLGGLTLFCAVMLPLGLLAFGATLRRARHDGSLNHY